EAPPAREKPQRWAEHSRQNETWRRLLWRERPTETDIFRPNDPHPLAWEREQRVADRQPQVKDDLLPLRLVWTLPGPERKPWQKVEHSRVSATRSARPEWRSAH